MNLIPFKSLKNQLVERRDRSVADSRRQQAKELRMQRPKVSSVELDAKLITLKQKQQERISKANKTIRQSKVIYRVRHNVKNDIKSGFKQNLSQLDKAGKGSKGRRISLVGF